MVTMGCHWVSRQRDRGAPRPHPPGPILPADEQHLSLGPRAFPSFFSAAGRGGGGGGGDDEDKTDDTTNRQPLGSFSPLYYAA